jgi:hypothetical protein
MCNASNHSFGCRCGWGGDTGGRRQNLNTFTGGLLRETKSSSGKKGYRIKCWWCSADVYYHTEGFNDCVLFDELGYPWQVHECWEQHKRERNNNMRDNDNQNSIQPITTAQQIFNAQQRVHILSFYLKKFKYSTDEHSIARKMGTSVEELRKRYGDLYSLDDMRRLTLYDYRKVEQTQRVLEEISKTKQQYSQTHKRTKPQILEIRRRQSEDNPK